jgi:hypothetical protein
MAITNTRLFTSSPTTVFQAVGQQAITVVYICNTSALPVSVNVYVVNNDDSTSSGDDNMILSELEVTANDTYIMSAEKLILDDLDKIVMEATVPDLVTVTVSSIAV